MYKNRSRNSWNVLVSNVSDLLTVIIDNLFFVIVYPILGITYKFTGNLVMKITDQTKQTIKQKPSRNILEIIQFLKDSHLTT